MRSAGLGVSLGVPAVKFTAYLNTRSLAPYSDALESIINVATPIAIIAIRIAARPADAGHPYGYHKAEYMSAVVIGALIIAAALAILHEAYGGFLAPRVIDAPWTGLAIGMVATILNAGWGVLIIRQGRLQRSAALVADGKHMLADVVTSLGVLVGVVLTVLTGIAVLDACIAVLVALHVLWNGYRILRENARALMDEAAPRRNWSVSARRSSAMPPMLSKLMLCELAMQARPPSSISIWWCQGL